MMTYSILIPKYLNIFLTYNKINIKKDNIKFFEITTIRIFIQEVLRCILY